MKIILYILRIHFEIIYFFIKLLTFQKNRVYLLSRQFDKPSLNYQMIINELEKEHIKYKVVCKKVDTSINDSVRTQGNYSNVSSLIKKVFKNAKSSIKYYLSLWSQMINIANSKIVIVDGYNLPVCLLKHKKGTLVIQLWHALGAIKKFGYQSMGKVDGISPTVAKILKMHAGYDYVISGSEGMAPYFAEAFNTPLEKVLNIGTPTVDYLRESRPEVKKEILKKYPVLKKKINVLYSPTFRNNKNFNYQDLIENTDFDKVNLIITYHFKVEEICDDKRVVTIPSSDFSVFDVLTICDYVISDYSALLVDAAVSNKKILMYVYDYDEYNKNNGVNIKMLEDFKKISSKSAKEIMNIIQKDKYDYKTYQKFQQMYTTDKKLSSTKELMKIIKKNLK